MKKKRAHVLYRREHNSLTVDFRPAQNRDGGTVEHQWLGKKRKRFEIAIDQNIQNIILKFAYIL